LIDGFVVVLIAQLSYRMEVCEGKMPYIP